MKKVNFTEERRGYDKVQVEKYVSMLQEAIEELEKESKKKDKELSEKQGQLQALKLEAKALNDKLSGQEIEFQGINQLLQNTVDKLKREASDMEKKIISLEFERDKLLIQKKENQDLKRQVEKLKSKLAESPMEGEEDGTKNELAEVTAQLQEIEKRNEELLLEKKELQAELLKEKERVTLSQKRSSEGMEELFLQAKTTADAYVEKVQNEVQEERRKLVEENERLVEAAKQEAAKILEEARAQKQTELDERLSQIELENEAKQAEITELIQAAKDELESARAEAEGIRNQSKIILEQAEKRRDKILHRAQDKALQLAVPLREDCNNLKKEMEEAAEKFAEFFRSLNDISNE